MNVLILGKDPSIFLSGKDVPNDTRKRHQWYARELRTQSGEKSSIRVISYSPHSSEFKVGNFPGLSVFPTQSFFRPAFLADLFRLIPSVLKRWKPDLITVQTPWEEGTFGFFLSKVLDVAFLPQLHFNIFSESWKRESFLNVWRQKMAFFLFSHSAGVRVVSEPLKKGLIETLSIPEQRVFVIPVCVDFTPVESGGDKNPFKREISPSLEGKQVVLFVGNFYPPKNLELWLDVAMMIAEKNNSARFVLVGDGPHFSVIRQRIQSSGFSERFFLTGKVGRERLPRLFCAADVFLLTSSNEGFGRVIIEAFMAGIPVVSTRSGGPESLIHPGENGFLFNSTEKKGLSETICMLLNNPSKSAEMGAKAREYAQKKFASTTLVSDLVRAWLKAAVFFNE